MSQVLARAWFGAGAPNRTQTRYRYHLRVARKRGVQVADLSGWIGKHVLSGWENAR
jgi:hypothetical protein